MITKEQLKEIYPIGKYRVDTFYPYIIEALKKYEINTPLRVAAFLAQIGHESAELRYTEEIASGISYEGRKDLGNISHGDGIKYKGRGLIQITGKTNYISAMMGLELDCVANPKLLELPENATNSAAWWWRGKGLNQLADKGEFLKITKIINGGTNGLADREKYYKIAKKVLKC